MTSSHRNATSITKLRSGLIFLYLVGAHVRLFDGSRIATVFLQAATTVAPLGCLLALGERILELTCIWLWIIREEKNDYPQMRQAWYNMQRPEHVAMRVLECGIVSSEQGMKVNHSNMQHHFELNLVEQEWNHNFTLVP
jgi:hypothetical protein